LKERKTTMTIRYSIFSSETEGSGATLIFSNGDVVSVNSENPNHDEVVRTLLDTKGETDEQAIRNLLNPGAGISARLTRLSERFSYDGANILYDGDVIHGAVVNHVLRILAENGTQRDWSAIVAFMEKAVQNPSGDSLDSLYEFIIRHGVVIDDDGDFYVYKGVKADGTSITAGPGIVDGVSMNGHLPNELGSILEMARSKVDADRSRGCSVGLHAGSYAYASNFAQGKLLTVKVNPRDVVSVPNDCSYQKIRVSRYKVTGIADHKIEGTTFSYDYVERPDNAYDQISEILDKDYDEVPVDFTYTRRNGSTTTVELNVTAIRIDGNGEKVLVGIRTDIDEDRERSYLAARISNLIVDIDTLNEALPEYDEDDDWFEEDAGGYDAEDEDDLYGYDDVEEDEDSDVLRERETVRTINLIRTAVLNGDSINVRFDYTTVTDEPRTLTGFEPTEIRTLADGRELLVGVREEDQEVRTYRLDRITNLALVA
jgi:hypothetical protein